MQSAMRLTRAATVLRAAAVSRGTVPSRMLRTAAPAMRKYQHLPLGEVPEDTNLGEVRSKWGSNAMDRINETAVIEVDDAVAVCDGGGGSLGHPIEYIKLFVSDEDAGPQVCKYCGLRYKRKLAS